MIPSRIQLCAWAVACLHGAGCADPELQSDLDPEGPPRVASVTVLGASSTEVATFCAQGSDIKVSRLYCPEARDDLDNPIAGERPFATVADTRPIGWYVRVVFDELLDPDVEELRDDDGDGRLDGHIDITAPVTLRCDDIDIAYDGFYNPAGNALSDPPGPSLVVRPISPFAVATGASCQLTLGDGIVDKQGNRVPDGERGPYEFSISPLTVIDVLPLPGAEDVDPAVIPVIAFNAPISVDGLSPDELTFQDQSGAPVAFTPLVPPDDPTLLGLIPGAPLAGATTYAITLSATTGLTDVLGGPLALPGDLIIPFTTRESAAGQ